MRYWGVYSGQVNPFDFLWLRFDSTALFYLTMAITTTTTIPSSSCQPTIEPSRPRLCQCQSANIPTTNDGLDCLKGMA